MLNRLTPWLPEEAVATLESLLDLGNDLKVFEYGCGMSTVWFAFHKNVSKVISIDHEIACEDEIVEMLRRTDVMGKVDIFHAQRPYHQKITTFFPDPGQYDIILIDGRDRVKCIEAAIPHLKPGGIMILDNSEREYYQKGIDLMEKWDKLYFYQPKPDRYGFTYPNWKCTFFYKPI